MIDPNDFVITRRRKKYRFAQFANAENCFELDDWTPNDKQYYVELGAGTALFSVELARRYPDRHYLAIDVKADRLQKGARYALEQGIANIQFIRAHAWQLEQVCRPGTINELWLTFSDPFPKDGHAKHRLTHPRFLAIYRKLLSDDALLNMKTDNHALFDWSLEQLVANKWNIAELSYDLHQSDMNDDCKIMTTFEKQFIIHAQTIYYLASVSIR